MKFNLLIVNDLQYRKWLIANGQEDERDACGPGLVSNLNDLLVLGKWPKPGDESRRRIGGCEKNTNRVI